MDHCQLRFLDVTFLAIKGYLLLQLSRSIPVFLPIQKYPFRSDFRHDDTLKALLSWATSLVWKKFVRFDQLEKNILFWMPTGVLEGDISDGKVLQLGFMGLILL